MDKSIKTIIKYKRNYEDEAVFTIFFHDINAGEDLNSLVKWNNFHVLFVRTILFQDEYLSTIFSR